MGAGCLYVDYARILSPFGGIRAGQRPELRPAALAAAGVTPLPSAPGSLFPASARAQVHNFWLVHTPYDRRVPETEVADRGGAVRWRTVRLANGKYIRVAVVRKRGKRGGRTVAGPVRRTRG